MKQVGDILYMQEDYNIFVAMKGIPMSEREESEQNKLATEYKGWGF